MTERFIYDVKSSRLYSACGHRDKMREMIKLVNEEVRMAQQLVNRF